MVARKVGTDFRGNDPKVNHRFCAIHLYANYRDNGYRGMALNEKLWDAAAAYTEADFHKE